VPVYKASISLAESASLLQLFTVLGSHPISLFTHTKLDLSVYQKLLIGKAYQIIYFDEFFFKDTASYSKLLCSKIFYKEFKKFKFLLIYQLDAWVFKDELNYWCSQNYDYIGAPWFSKNEQDDLVFEAVGNGGFSLRNVKSHLRVLNSFSFTEKPGYVYYLLKKTYSIKKSISILIEFLFYKNTHYLFNGFQENEDRFWSMIAFRNFKWFKTPSKELALKFSIEVYPSYFIDTESDLPFGCHAWEKYDRVFWNKFIKI